MPRKIEPNANSTVLAVPVIKARVLGVDVIRGFARLCDLARISYADVYDAKTNPTGTQRDLSPKHARDAYEYVQREDVAFWPEIFLALREDENFSFSISNKDTGYGVARFNIRKIEDSKFIEISRVDGNHRLHFADGKTEGYSPITKIVSFCLAIKVDLETEIKLFRDINNNQRRMNTSHLDNIKLRLDSEEVIARRDPMLYLANKLKSDPVSPFFNLVYDGGRSDVTKFIPLRTLKTGLEYMFSRPTRLTALENIKIQALMVRNYFNALKKWQPDAWKRPKDYLLLRGAGLWGACFLGAEIIDRALAKGHYKVDDMFQILRSGPEWDWTKDGSFGGLSGRSGAVKIRDRIAAELEDEAGVSLTTVMKRIANDL
jgi:DGQHR domain-containing protein